jgi:hypothetical protein
MSAQPLPTGFTLGMAQYHLNMNYVFASGFSPVSLAHYVHDNEGIYGASFG